MRRPSRRGSKRDPCPDFTSSSTRLLGSFATSRPRTNIAKIRPFTLSPADAMSAPAVTARAGKGAYDAVEAGIRRRPVARGATTLAHGASS
jgi:hypothetical protein